MLVLQMRYDKVCLLYTRGIKLSIHAISTSSLLELYNLSDYHVIRCKRERACAVKFLPILIL